MYRASTTACILHDSSYKRSIQVSGPQADLCDLFDKLLDPMMARPRSQRYLAGHRYGSGIFYDGTSRWPFGVVGPVEFLWKQEECLNSQQAAAASDQPDRMIWLFVHPSIHESVLSVLLDTTSMIGIPDITLLTTPPFARFNFGFAS